VWIVGVVLLFILGAAIVVAIGWEPRRREEPAMWDIPGLSGFYTGIVGTLAGFSIAAATFIAGISSAQGTPAFAAAIGMLLVSFLTLMGSAMMYSDTPSFPASDDEFNVMFQSLSYVLANALYFLGLSLGWLAMRPLLVMIGLDELADAFTWLLLATVVAGSTRIAVFVYRLTAANKRACIAIPVLGIALPVIYWLLADRIWPALWPAENAAIGLSFVAFAVASIGYIHQTVLLVTHGGSRVEQTIRQNRHRFAPAYLLLISQSVTLVWLAAATLG
jgi:hypothetical protein